MEYGYEGTMSMQIIVINYLNMLVLKLEYMP